MMKSKSIKLLTAVLATMFFGSLVPSVLATEASCIVLRYTDSGGIWGLMGEAALFNTYWNAPSWESASFWTTLVLGEQHTVATFAEVNLKADRVPLLPVPVYTIKVCFAWRDSGGVKSGNIVDISYAWGQYIGLKVERTSDNVYTGYYKLPGGSWTIIGSKTYSHNWVPHSQFTGLEVTHPASTGQGYHVISRWQNMKQKVYNGDYVNNWNPYYPVNGESYPSYNIKEYYHSPQYGQGYWAAGTIQ